MGELDSVVTGCRCKPTCDAPCCGLLGVTYTCKACECTPPAYLDRENYDEQTDDALLDYLEAA